MLDYKPARPGDVLLLTVPHYWGKGKTFAEAKHKLREVSGMALAEHREYHVYSVHPETDVDPVYGDISYPKGHKPIRLNGEKR